MIVINAGSGPITLNNTGNNFSGNTSVAANTTGAVSLVNGNAGGINLAASTVGGALSLTSGGPVTQSGPITVGAGPIDHFTVTAPASTAVGASFSFTVTAKDGLGNTVTTYSGLVQFTSTDGAAAAG